MGAGLDLPFAFLAAALSLSALALALALAAFNLAFALAELTRELFLMFLLTLPRRLLLGMACERGGRCGI